MDYLKWSKQFGVNGAIIGSLLEQLGKKPSDIDTRYGWGERFTAHVINGHNSNPSAIRMQILAYECGVDINILLKKPSPLIPPRKRQRCANFKPTTLQFRWDATILKMVGAHTLEHARTILSYGGCSWTYFMPDAMATWFITRALDRLHWEPTQVQGLLPAANKYRQDCLFSNPFNYRRIHVIQKNIFTDAHLLDEDWVGIVTDNLVSTGKQEKLALMENDARKECEKRMAEIGYHGCCAVDVIDDVVAVIQPQCYGTQYVIRDKLVVQAIRTTILNCINDLGKPSPTAATEAVSNGRTLSSSRMALPDRTKVHGGPCSRPR
jgi:hypothetical protein